VTLFTPAGLVLEEIEATNDLQLAWGSCPDVIEMIIEFLHH
jgi:hypothetical protein